MYPLTIFRTSIWTVRFLAISITTWIIILLFIHSSISRKRAFISFCAKIDRNVPIPAAHWQPHDMLKRNCTHAQSIDTRLHVIMTVFNAAGYASRYNLAHQFIKHIDNYQHVALYVVELAYGNQTHQVASPDHPRHLQLRTAIPFWHKENLINLGVERLLPRNWKALAWIDAEIEFESPTWDADTLRMLSSGVYDVVQLFSYGVDLDEDGRTKKVYTGFGYNHVRDIPYQKKGLDMWHPGYAWACTRQAYDQFGGLFEGNILGGGDQSTAYATMGMHAKLPDTLKMFPSPGYKKAITKWEEGFKGIRLGYIPGVALHHFHGSVQDRKYWERRDLLSDVAFDPLSHVKRDHISGVIVPTEAFPKELAAGILRYFKSRNEDAHGQEESTIDERRRSFPTQEDVRSIILDDTPVDGCLHLIVLIYPRDLLGEDPPAQDSYDTRVFDYMQRLSSTYTSPNVQIYTVEMVYKGHHHFSHTSGNASRHLQVTLPTNKFWSKCRVLNLAIKTLIPNDWQALAYVDVGVEFDSRTWPQDALRLLSSGTFDVIQPFTHAVHIDTKGNTARIWTGFGYNNVRGLALEGSRSSPDYWYPGLAWIYSPRRVKKAKRSFWEVQPESPCDDIRTCSCLGLETNTRAYALSISSASSPRTDKMRHQTDSRQINRAWPTMTRVGYVPGVVRQSEIFIKE